MQPRLDSYFIHRSGQHGRDSEGNNRLEEEPNTLNIQRFAGGYVGTCCCWKDDLAYFKQIISKRIKAI